MATEEPERKSFLYLQWQFYLVLSRYATNAALTFKLILRLKHYKTRLSQFHSRRSRFGLHPGIDRYQALKWFVSAG